MSASKTTATSHISATSCSVSTRLTASSAPSPRSSAHVDSPPLSSSPAWPLMSTLLEFARFAAPPELAMCLRWGLARVLRVSVGNAVRGLISWDMYVEWCEAEVVQEYPITHFQALIAPLQQPLPSIIINVLSLLARLTAHSSSSGHTPPTLSPLFGPFFLASATPHAPSNESSGSFGGGPGSAASLGVPTRLKDWIRGYPAMLPDPATRTRKQDRLQPRRGARTVRVISVRRNVRMYTPDLVKNAASWGSRPLGGAMHAPNVFVQSREWERVAPPTLKLAPRYADSFKKRMDLPPTFHPHTGVASSNASTASSTTVSTLGDDFFGIGKPAVAGEERFRSLTELKWGEFETMGFGGLESSEKKLQFDLTESARTNRAAKRTTLTWTDFSASGFSRMDAPLSATLQFSTPLVNSVSSWPEQHADITRKLRKTQKSLPPFGWDTEPVMGTEAVIEEAFIDVFCDLMYGGGWMDLDREEVDRECNWALIEFKSLPLTRSSVSGGSDPRTSTTVFLFEEFVPLEYRQQLFAGVQNKRTLASFFSPGKTKQWKQAATLNGRPYVVGHVPRSLNTREVEFEGLIRANNSSTKMISLGRDGPVKRDVAHPETPTSQTPIPWRSPRSEDISSPLFVTPRESTVLRPVTPTTPATPPVVTKRRFRLPTGLPLTPNFRTSGLTPSEAEDVDFETRLTSYSDDELQSIHSNSRRITKHERRASKDDAWVDILVANHARRAVNQDVDMRRPGGPRGRNVARPDPEVASQEVAQVLAAIRGPSPLGPFDMFDGGSEADIEPMNVPHRSMINSHGGSLIEEIYAHTIPESEGTAEPEPQPQPEPEVEVEVDPEPEPIPEPQVSHEQPPPRPPRRIGYFDMHPERRLARIDIDEDPRDSVVGSLAEGEDERPRRSDVTESVYSCGTTTPPASPKPVLAALATTEMRPPEPALTTTIPSPQTPTPTPRDLARQQEVRDRLSGKPGPKASSLIEMYREKERLATTVGGSKGGSPGKLPSIATAIAPIQPPPPPSEPFSTPIATSASVTPTQEMMGGEVVVEGTDEFTEPPNLEFAAPGRDSPFRYVHGAPLHNVVEEEEED
ncbi:hypothetical protein BJV78DRAFT_1228260 [Lactifluus subvellereus]|nr:hypothetical protein BJV78DRAFT_1228260 [Lactifluus subvellereus]